MTTGGLLGRRHHLVPACLLGYAALASTTRPLTAAAIVAVVVPAAVVAALVPFRRPGRRRAAPAPGVRRATVAWSSVMLLAVGWELAAWMQQPAYNVASHDHPTLSLLLDPLIEPWPVRFAAWACWLLAGYRLVLR